MNLSNLSRAQKVQLAEALAERERRRKANPLAYFERHAKQQEGHVSDKAIRAFFWGNRVGKTEFGGSEVAEYASLHHPYRELKPPFEIWSACPSFDVQEYTTQQKLLRYLPADLIAHTRYVHGRVIKTLTLKNGVEIIFKSYEQGREKFQGAGVRLMWFDEEPPHDIWEEAFVRVEAGQQLDVLLTMTAVKGMTWVYDDIYLNTSDPDLFVSEAGWDDNPHLTEEQKAQMSRGLSAQAIQVRRHGKFVKRVGLVCDWWERTKHLKHYDYLDKTWTWYEVNDPGWSDPNAYLLIGVDHDNNVHVVDGFRERELEAPEIKRIRDTKVSGLLITQGFVDNNDPRLVRDLAKAGMRLTPVKKESKDASWDETLAEKLAEYGRVQKGTGEPRLFISDTLVRVSEKSGKEENWMVQEIENLVWLERTSKQGEEIVPKWDEHRRFNHHFDGVRALAYFLVSYMRPEPEQDDEDDDQDASSLLY